jgi:hypothetical protein
MMEQLEESILDLFETILEAKVPNIYISAETRSLNKFFIQSNKKCVPLKIEQIVDGEQVTTFGDFFALQIRKTPRQRYHVDLFVKKTLTSNESVSKDIMRIPNFSQEKADLMEIVVLVENLFVGKEYLRSVQMKLKMLK